MGAGCVYILLLGAHAANGLYNAVVATFHLEINP